MKILEVFKVLISLPCGENETISSQKIDEKINETRINM